MKSFFEHVKDVRNEKVEKEYLAFIKKMYANHVIFHPDDPIKDYQDTETKKPAFTPVEAKKLQAQLDNFHKVLGDKVYELGLDLQKKHFKKHLGIDLGSDYDKKKKVTNEDLTRETVDLKKNGNKISVRVSERGKEIWNKDLAKDITVQNLIAKFKQETDFKGKVDKSVSDLYPKDIGEIAFDNLVEFQVNQNDTLVANPSIKK